MDGNGYFSVFVLACLILYGIARFICWLREEDGWYGDVEAMERDRLKMLNNEISYGEFKANQISGKYFKPLYGYQYSIGKKKRGKKTKPKTLEENLAERRAIVIKLLTKLYTTLGKDPSMDNIENDFRNFKIRGLLSIEHRKSFLYDDGEVALGIDWLGNIHEKEFFCPNYFSWAVDKYRETVYKEMMAKKMETQNN